MDSRRRMSKYQPQNISMAAAAVFLLLLVWCQSPTVFSISPVEKFEQWAALHKPVYKDENEKLYRLGVFTLNMERINAFHEGGKPRNYSLGLTRFADLTHEEFIATYPGGSVPPTNASHDPVQRPFSYGDTTAPGSIDWRDQGAVTPVKNQGQCDCSWAFSAVASIESINKIVNGKLISLSEQELVSCDQSNNGCGGGFHDRAFSFIISNGGITTEENYPYEGTDQTQCDTYKQSDYAVTLSGYTDVPPNDESSLMQAVANQPVSVAIDAHEFQMYNGGIFDGPCGSNLNHEVTLVGYGTDSNTGMSYWIAKNSWGTTWGAEGYIYLKKDFDDPQGICGLAMKPSYPTIESGASYPKIESGASYPKIESGASLQASSFKVFVSFRTILSIS